MKYLILMFCLVLSSCLNESQSTNSSTNSEIKVELLFEYDGVKVYRFFDGRFIYYTDARGKTQYNGSKGSTVEVETAR